MRLFIDCTPLLLRSAGVKTYIYQWTRHVLAAAGQHDVRLFPLLGGLGELNHERSTHGTAGTYARLALLYLSNTSGLSVVDCLTRGADIFHASNQVFRMPSRSRTTTTIHDLTCWLMPHLHAAANVQADKRFAERVTKRADGLIAVSENTRRDAVRLLGLKPEKIAVIHPGVADEYFRAASCTSDAVRERYGLSRPYILFVGTVEPRKNLDTMLDAYGQLALSVREQYEMVVVGPMGWASRQTAARVRSGEPGVQYLGYVPESDLPTLTAGATAFVYPSLYEGFGLPVAQGMAAGVPVITSNVSSLPEVAGDAALLVDPLSCGEIRAAMERLLLSGSMRSELALKGRKRAERYRWQECARKSLMFFERVYGG